MDTRSAIVLGCVVMLTGAACRGRLPGATDVEAPLPEPVPAPPAPESWKPGFMVLQERRILSEPSGLHPGDIASETWGQGAFYTSREGDEMVGLAGLSTDGGQTWTGFAQSAPVTPEGSRRWIYSDWVDPVEDRLVQSVLALDAPSNPEDPEPLIGLTAYYMLTRTSSDHGRSYAAEELVQQEGQPAEEPFPGVRIGESGYFLGDVGSRPIRTSSGEILLPLQYSPLAPEGGLFNPGGGYTYTHALIARGHWTDDGLLRWHGSAVIPADPARSTRGMLEPTLAEMPDGSILCVLRGSNGGGLDPDFEIPSYRWASVSHDGGSTWSPPTPWTWDDGEPFYSPSSMSHLLVHSNGRVYWTGNIADENPEGNSPRDHLYMGEVGPDRTLVRSSVLLLDGPGLEDSNGVSISHVLPFEDRRTGAIVLPTWRYDGDYAGGQPVSYVIAVPTP